MTTQPLILPRPSEVQRLRAEAGVARWNYLIALVRRWFGSGSDLPTGPVGTPTRLPS